jgi:hypothetical protein
MMEFEEIPDFPACCQRERFPERQSRADLAWGRDASPKFVEFRDPIRHSSVSAQD